MKTVDVPVHGSFKLKIVVDCADSADWVEDLDLGLASKRSGAVVGVIDHGPGTLPGERRERSERSPSGEVALDRVLGWRLGLTIDSIRNH